MNEIVIEQIQNVVAGTVFIIPFKFPAQLGDITNLKVVIKYIITTVTDALNAVYNEGIRFHVILNIGCMLKNIETGETREHTIVFPEASTFAIRTKNDINN
jgi:hypothetical protein